MFTLLLIYLAGIVAVMTDDWELQTDPQLFVTKMDIKSVARDLISAAQWPYKACKVIYRLAYSRRVGD